MSCVTLKRINVWRQIVLKPLQTKVHAKGKRQAVFPLMTSQTFFKI